MAWKKTTQVFQTAGVPPSRGSTIFANIGCTRNSSHEDTRIAEPKRIVRPRSNARSARRTRLSIERQERVGNVVHIRPPTLSPENSVTRTAR